MNRPLPLSIVVLAVLACPRTIAQGYNYRYGDSRIVIQSETGLSHPSGTYIGPGTISKSAQGAVEVGAQANPGLPKVNHGGFVGTPGDNQYGNNPIHSVEPRRVQARRAPQFIYIKPQEPPKPKEYMYIPGQNAPMQYSSGASDTAVQVDGRGAASYGSSSGSERRF